MDEEEICIASVDEKGQITVLRHIYFQCTGCAECCIANRIPVTEKDLLRMQENGIEFDQALEEMSPVLIPSNNVEDSFVKAYILRKKPFVNECVFLDEEKKCKIHEFKPLACRIYPFAVRIRKGKIVVLVHPHSVCKFIHLDVPEEESNTLEIVEYLLSLKDLE
ncbi:MAG: YkgJ family cysteine cluster protein [Candidatus Heimdallarchaeaceae archaeon]